MKKYISVLIALALLTGCSGGAGFPEESVVYESETTTVKSVNEESETETAAAEAVTETSEAETSVQTTSETTQPSAETEETVSETTSFKFRARDVNPPDTEAPSAKGVFMGVKRGDYDCDEHAYSYLIRSQEQLDIYNGYTEDRIIFEDIDFEKYSIAVSDFGMGSSNYKYFCKDTVIDGRYIHLIYGIEGGGFTDDMVRFYGYALIPNELLTEENYYGWRTPGDEYGTENYSEWLTFETKELCAEKICAYAEKYGADSLMLSYNGYNGEYSFTDVRAEFSDKESAEEFKKLFENGFDEIPYDTAEDGNSLGFKAIECGVGLNADAEGEYDCETISKGLDRFAGNCLVENIDRTEIFCNCDSTALYYRFNYELVSDYNRKYYNRAWRADISTPAEFDKLCEDMNYFPYGNGYFEFNIEAFFVFE